MKKSELLNLVAGAKVQSVKTGEVLEIAGMDTEQGKYILTNGKSYTASTIQRWWTLVEEIPEPVEPDNTVIDDIEQADELTQEPVEPTVEVEPVEPQDTTQNEQDDNQVKQQPANDPQDVVEPTIQQNNLIQSLNNLINLHGCTLEPKREYIKISKEGYKGTICMIRNTRKGNIHIDMKSKIFAALTEQYKDMLIEKYDAKIYDKSRGYFRISECDDLDVLEVVITKALLLNGEVLAV